MDYFINIKINDHIYQIKDRMGVLMTLIIGKEQAMLIDTGYGIYNIYDHIRSITSLPLIVVNSHGHMDHCCGTPCLDCKGVPAVRWRTAGAVFADIRARLLLVVRLLYIQFLSGLIDE